MIYTISSSLLNELPEVTAVNGEYLFWFPYWQTIRDCIMGEIMVKARSTRYLPRLSSQSDEEYKAHLERATFYNATARTLAGLVGAVHNRPPTIDGVPSSMPLTNITNDGQSFDMFMKKITKEVIGLGRYGVMIDAPPSGGDPYFVGYQTEDIVDWSVSRYGSRERLDYVVLREYSLQRRPFQMRQDEIKTQYRVLFIDEQDGIYKQRVYQSGNLDSEEYTEIVPLLQGKPMQEIPFLMISPYDFGFEVEKPPILDIALLNLSHYRSYAQLEAGRFYTATPVYATFLSGGGDEDAEYKVGPNVVWQLGSQDKAEIIEFSGAGLKYLENAITTKEQQMAALGGKMASQTRGLAAESADAVLAREKGEASFLGSVIATLNEAATRMLNALSTWRGTPANTLVQYSSDATEILLDARQIRAIQQLFESGLMPLETIYTVYRQNNVIPHGITFEEFKSILPTTAPKVEAKLDEAAGKAEIEVEVAEKTAKINAKYAPKPAPKPPAAKNTPAVEA